MKWLRIYPVAATVLMLLSACTMGGKPAVMVQQYALEYAPPTVQRPAPAEQVLRIDRFSVAQIFNSVRMVYRLRPSHYNDYAYHRWRANPGDMVGDSLLRDLREAGLFKSVLSYRDAESTRYLLKGDVAEFFESDAADGRKAVLAVHLTLMDTTAGEPARQILLQRSYRYEESLAEKTVQGFAQAMSRAVQKWSAQALEDIRQTTENRK